MFDLAVTLTPRPHWFVRCHANRMHACTDGRTDACIRGQTNRKHNASAASVGGVGIKMCSTKSVSLQWRVYTGRDDRPTAKVRFRTG